MEQQQQQSEEVITDVALIEQDKSTVKILQEDDLKTVKETMEKVSGFKRKYTVKKLTVTDIDSKDQKEKLRLAMADLRTTRTTLDETRKTKIKPYQETIAFINGNYNKAIDIIKEMEAPLKVLKSDVDEKIEARDKEAEIQAQARLNSRVAQIINAKMVFDGEFYSIGSEEFNVPAISLGIVDLQTMTDGVFENVLGQIIEKNEAITKAQAEKDEAACIAEQERLDREAEEKRLFEEQQAKLKKEQDDLAAEMAEFKKQKEELAKQQEELAKQKEAEAARLLAEENARIEKLWRSRLEQIEDAGWDGQKSFDSGNNGSKIFTYEELISLSLTDFENRKQTHNAMVLERREQKRIAYEKERILKEQKELEEKQAEEERIKKQAIADQKYKEEQDELNRQAELLKLGDKSVWEDFIIRLKAITYPEFKSVDYKNKVGSVRDFITDLK